MILDTTSELCLIPILCQVYKLQWQEFKRLQGISSVSKKTITREILIDIISDLSKYCKESYTCIFLKASSAYFGFLRCNDFSVKHVYDSNVNHSLQICCCFSWSCCSCGSEKIPDYWIQSLGSWNSNCYLDRVKRILYLSPMRAAKVQASLRIRAVSPEPSLLAYTSSESRGTVRQKARSLAPLNGWACAVKICNDGILEVTNSLDGAQFYGK